MSANITDKNNNKHLYLYINNRGILSTIIFKDKEDYGTFIKYLKEYLGAPADPDKIKEKFVVKGQIFNGIPHQPKNYFNKIELVSYNLKPNSFHLVLHQLSENSIQHFLRSLSTRYVIYYNKKYNRNGPLLERPYKSIQVEARSLVNDFVSPVEYLNPNINSWSKPNIVLSFIDKSENTISEKSNGKRKVSVNITAEEKSEYLPRGQPMTTKNNYLNFNSKHYPIIPRVVVGIGIYLLLFSFGLRNVRTTSAKYDVLPPTSTPFPQVTKESQVIEPMEEVPKKMLVVKVNEETMFTDIHRYANTGSEVIGRAKNGDTFEYVSKLPDWYEVKLDNKMTGFISEKNMEILKPVSGTDLEK